MLRGRPHLRTPDGWRQLDEGDVVAFPLGERGAHQLANRTGEHVRLVMISEMRSPEIAGLSRLGQDRCARARAGQRPRGHAAQLPHGRRRRLLGRRGPAGGAGLSEIRALGVVGAGTMGAGIAQVAASAGFETLPARPVSGGAGARPGRVRTRAREGRRARALDGGRRRGGARGGCTPRSDSRTSPAASS